MDTIYKLLKCLCFAAGGVAANAGAEQAVSLEVGGNSKTVTTPGCMFQLTPAQFQALPQSTMVTTTSRTQVVTFSGVKTQDLIRTTGAQASYALVYPLEDYSTRLPVSSFRKYGPIIVRYMHSQTLPHNGFGPYFVIYPKDTCLSESNTPTTEAKFAWQVNRIEFK